MDLSHSYPIFLYKLEEAIVIVTKRLIKSDSRVSKIYSFFTVIINFTLYQFSYKMA